MDEKECVTPDESKKQEQEAKSCREMFIPSDFCSCLPPVSYLENPCTVPQCSKMSSKERRRARIHGRRNNPIGTLAVRGKQLRTAVSLNDTDRVHHLLQSGVDPNSCDNQQRAPLHLAACKGYTDIMNLLLQFGANPNNKDNLGNTPLHLAACTNNINVITLLLDAGTDVVALDKLGRTPLHLAQSKLRLIKQVKKDRVDTNELLNLRLQVQQIVNMMLSFLSRDMFTHSPNADLDELSTKLNKLKTTDIVDVDLEVSKLLDDLQVLELNKS